MIVSTPQEVVRGEMTRLLSLVQLSPSLLEGSQGFGACRLPLATIPERDWRMILQGESRWCAEEDVLVDGDCLTLATARLDNPDRPLFESRILFKPYNHSSMWCQTNWLTCQFSHRLVTEGSEVWEMLVIETDIHDFQINNTGWGGDCATLSARLVFSRPEANRVGLFGLVDCDSSLSKNYASFNEFKSRPPRMARDTSGHPEDPEYLSFICRHARAAWCCFEEHLRKKGTHDRYWERLLQELPDGRVPGKRFMDQCAHLRHLAGRLFECERNRKQALQAVSRAEQYILSGKLRSAGGTLATVVRVGRNEGADELVKEVEKLRERLVSVGTGG